MSVSVDSGDRRAPVAPERLFASAAARDLGPLAVIAAFVAEPSTRDFALVNLGVQAVIFLFAACLPAYRTRVMAFADLAWPWGLVAIGVQALLFGDAGSALLVAVAAIYVVMGLREGIWAIAQLTRNFPRDDLPRYQYRRLEWRREGYRTEVVPMLHEIAGQGLGNASFLVAPAMLAVADRDAPLGPVVVAAAALWAVSWALESTADLQKARFLRRAADAGASRTCDVGLWGRSRHPNYFFQWLQWNALVLIALPSLVRVADDVATLPWVGFAVALVGIPAGMYHVLVHLTGAIPAEHFSVQHRADYRDYQQRVNRFVPGPSRSLRSGADSRRMGARP